MAHIYNVVTSGAEKVAIGHVDAQSVSDVYRQLEESGIPADSILYCVRSDVEQRMLAGYAWEDEQRALREYLAWEDAEAMAQRFADGEEL